MPMDVDAVVVQQYMEKLDKIVSQLPHMGRSEICDDIIEFVNKMEKKYSQKERPKVHGPF